MGLGFADAYDAYAMGDYQKMLDRMLPAVARNLVVANRYADEGMKTGRGVELVGKDDVKTGEIIGQAIGFRPDILAATQGPTFKYAGIDNWQSYIETNPAFVRPAELHSLCGDPTKAEKVLGWKRRTDFDGLVKMMVEADIKRYSK